MLATLAVAASGGGGDDQVFCSSASSSSSAGSGMGGSGGGCSLGSFRCTGDDLEHCADEGSGFKKVVTCPVGGLCDVAGGQYDACKAGNAKCIDGATLSTCSSDGHVA